MRKDSIIKIVNQLWRKHGRYINKIFIQGSPTCIYATKVVAEYFLKKNLGVVIADGNYKGDAHWFPIISFSKGKGFYDRYIIDLGNNLKFAEGNKSIKPIIVRYPNPFYTIDEYLTLKEFKKYIKKIKIDL